ncbi:MAG: rotamase [Alphaproteobacteria bacterium]|nr:MAG: rotamase [Alphaproteobacteria bacterium]PZO39755.1 MAG: rotamase [Alphaproteobacteria bacterium]
MISVFRKFAKSKWAIGLLVLLGLSLLVTGAQMDVFSGLGSQNVISAGERSVSRAEFRSDFESVRENVQQQAGRPVTIEDMVAENIHVRFLEEQTERMGFMEWAWKAGIRPGQELVVKQIRGIPAFFNQVTGQFNQEQYEQALAAQKMTPERLERDFRDQYIQTHYGSAVFAGTRMPRIYGALLAGQALENRDGRWFTVTQAMAGTAGTPTDAQLTAFLNENAEQLRRPEFRIASVVLFNDAPSATPPAIPEADILKRFDFLKASLSKPETRSFITLSAPTREAAQRITAALRAGQTPAEAGAAADVQPATQTDVPQSAVADPAVGAAVFALAAGAVSDPIQARVGFTVAQMTGITPAQPASLESAREAIVQELRDQNAKAAVFSRVEAYEKARGEGKTLAAAAQQVGARIVQLPPVTKEGRLPDGQPMNAPPQILEQTYALTKGAESDVIDAGQGQYFALRLDEVTPAALPALAEVRAPLAQEWTNRENARLLAAKAEQLAGQVRAGQDIAAVAATAGATLTNRASIVQNPQAQQELGQGVLQGLFGQGKGQVFSAPGPNATFVIGRVDAVRPAAPAEAAPIAEQVRGRMAQDWVTEAVMASIKAAGVRAKAKNDPALAREALGLPPLPEGDAAATPATPAPAA